MSGSHTDDPLIPRDMFALLFLVYLFTVIIVATEVGTVNSPSILQILDVGIGIGLSLALVYIYWTQNSILDTQTNIQTKQIKITAEQTKIADRQAQTMEGAHVPILTVHHSGIRLFTGHPQMEKSRTESANWADEPWEAIDILNNDENWVGLFAENLGNEIAQNVQLQTILSYDKSASTTTHTYDHHRYDLTVDEMQTEPSPGHGAILPTESGLSLLKAEPKVYNTAGGRASPLLTALRNLVVKDEITVQFGFVLVFENTFEKPFTVDLEPAFQLRPGQFSSRSDLTLESIVEQGSEYDQDDLRSDSDWEPPTQQEDDVEAALNDIGLT